MNTEVWRQFSMVVLVLFFLSILGCDQFVQNNTSTYVMFEGRPNLHHQEVFFNGKIIGRITASDHKGSTITRLAIAIAPQFKNRVNSNWILYADRGRLKAERLQGSSAPFEDGDILCGFSSIGALQWFKFKTLLNDRSYKAAKRAEYLAKRFELL